MAYHVNVTPDSRTAPLTSKDRQDIFRAYNIVYYVVWALEVLLAFRFFFRLLGANPASGFVRFIYGITYPFMLPFFGIFGTPRTGNIAFETPTLIGMAVYLVLAYAIVKIIRIITATHEEDVGADRP